MQPYANEVKRVERCGLGLGRVITWYYASPGGRSPVGNGIIEITDSVVGV
jgi:hypothetical protein